MNGSLCNTVFDERARKHQQDAEDRSEDSHMVKHWRICHPELLTHPKFNIKVTGTNRNALSRQVVEAVLIDLRGGRDFGL
jgi:hypothetical protein